MTLVGIQRGLSIVIGMFAIRVVVSEVGARTATAQAKPLRFPLALSTRLAIRGGCPLLMYVAYKMLDPTGQATDLAIAVILAYHAGGKNCCTRFKNITSAFLADQVRRRRALDCGSVRPTDNTHALYGIIRAVAWEVEYTDEFEDWWNELSPEAQDGVAPSVELLARFGPGLSFPHSSGIQSSRHDHMRELRIQHKGRPIRILYAFDPRRSAILLIGGDKTGQDRWYEMWVPVADRIYDRHLTTIGTERDGGKHG